MFMLSPITVTNIITFPSVTLSIVERVLHLAKHHKWIKFAAEIVFLYFHCENLEKSLLCKTHHVDSTLKRRGNCRFHVVSTWYLRGVFAGIMTTATVIIIALIINIKIAIIIIEITKNYYHNNNNSNNNNNNNNKNDNNKSNDNSNNI